MTKEDENAFEAKKSFEFADDSALMLKQASKETTKAVQKEPMEMPKSLEQINEANTKELQGEMKAMKNEIKEI